MKLTGEKQDKIAVKVIEVMAVPGKREYYNPLQIPWRNIAATVFTLVNAVNNKL